MDNVIYDLDNLKNTMKNMYCNHFFFLTNSISLFIYHKQLFTMHFLKYKLGYMWS